MSEKLINPALYAELARKLVAPETGALTPVQHESYTIMALYP